MHAELCCMSNWRLRIPPNLSILGVAVLALAANVSAQSLTNVSSVVAAAGEWISGGTYSNLNCVAQSGGIAKSSNGSLRHYAGFLGTFLLRPDLDTDGNGLANELDEDNDGDGLRDESELAGDAFRPVTTTDIDLADTDGDGATDYEEAAAGTDPTDSDAGLFITDITPTGDDVLLSWLARGGKTYEVHSRDGSILAAQSTLATTNATGGVGPWFVTTNFFLDTTASTVDKRFYRVEVVP